MTKVSIRITMQDGTPGLNAVGNIYTPPVHDDSVPITEGVRVRATHPWEGELAPGHYQYRYELQDGQGDYFLKMFCVGEATPRTVSGPLDGLAHRGNIFRFDVVKPAPATLQLPSADPVPSAGTDTGDV